MPHSLNDVLPLDDLGATIFFQVVSARYDRGGIILTSNKSYGEWGSTFGDPIIATAILDRLLHHSTTINIRRESSFSASRSRRILPGLADLRPEIFRRHPFYETPDIGQMLRRLVESPDLKLTS